MDREELAARLKAAHDGALRADAWSAVAAEVARIVAEREARRALCACGCGMTPEEVAATIVAARPAS